MPASVLRTLFRRTEPENSMTTSQPTTADVPATTPTAVMRFLTQGGATVEVRSHRFTTHYTWQGRPYVSGDSTREVDGFVWECLGCDADGRFDGSRGPSLDYGRYLPNERDVARRDANSHAEKCRALPRPDQP
ncbi:hypothetical protein [Streptomyces natalensis]|uniref:Uncharacterized protein n=1 Tax=Streptomyces natalensis ATCC 27448 TaxID=1240678 RepID=A0A0D7CMR4_9ACTN|nr:hypothetical protein [Streptomyces natalensis]KIZ17356.1 hypothetical protein SNA_15220 [Streptomyces natalensis ATCC 27448]